MAQWVKDPASSQQRLGLLVAAVAGWIPDMGTSTCQRQKKKKKKKKILKSTGMNLNSTATSYMTLQVILIPEACLLTCKTKILSIFRGLLQELNEIEYSIWCYYSKSYQFTFPLIHILSVALSLTNLYKNSPCLVWTIHFAVTIHT